MTFPFPLNFSINFSDMSKQGQLKREEFYYGGHIACNNHSRIGFDLGGYA